MKTLIAAALLCAFALPAFAQNAITQEGTVLKDSPMMFKGNNRARQGATVDKAPFGQTVTTGDAVVGGRCDYSAPTDDAAGYYKLCLDATNGKIIAGGTKTPPHGLKFEIDGVTYEAPFPGAGNADFYLEDYGGTGDGVANDAQALIDTVKAASTAGGGTVRLRNKQYLIDTAVDLSAYKNVTIQGNPASAGSDTFIVIAGDYMIRPYSLIVNQSVSITLGAHQMLYGVNIARKGMLKPTSAHMLQTEIDKFAGTALICPAGKHDVRIVSSSIIGFAQPLKTSCDRLTLTDLAIDTANGKGVEGVSCYDFCHWTRVETWPFVHAPDIEQMDMNVTGAANNGSGLIRITVNAAPPEALVTGDTISVGNVGGVPNATGRFKITVINPTTFDLQASTWAGAFTSGGQLVWKPLRPGAGMTLQGGIYMLHSYQNFGNDKGLDIVGDASFPTYAFCDSNCWIDGYLSPDPVKIGVNINGSVAQVTYQGTIISAGTAVLLNSDATFMHISDSWITGAYAKGSSTYPVKLVDGGLWISGSRLIAVNDTKTVYVGPNANLLTLTASDFLNQGGFAFDAGSDKCNIIVINGAIGPCVWTPGVAFGGASVGVAYDPATNGYWTQNTQGLVYMAGRLKLTSKGTSTGNATITNLPKQGTFNVAGTCGVANHANLTATTGWEINIPGLSYVASLGGYGGPYTDTNFTNTSEMYFACTILGQ